MTLSKIVEWASEILLVLLLVDSVLKPIANGYNQHVLTARMLNKLYHRRKISLNAAGYNKVSHISKIDEKKTAVDIVNTSINNR